MPAPKLRFDSSDFKRIIGDELPKKFQKFGMKTLEQVSGAILERMKQPGKPLVYPYKIHWDSLKQMRFVMWLLRSTNDLPYTRKGFYVNAWTRKTITNGYFIHHPNGVVGGTILGWQSKIHKGRWNALRRVVFEEVARLDALVQHNLKIYIRKESA